MKENISRRDFISKSLVGVSAFALGDLNFIINSGKSEYDVIIKNGLVFDGLGKPGRELDIAIKGDKIALMQKRISSKAKQIIDAEGYAVAPGFIDAHTHTDDNLIIDPRGESQIRQGVTTDISGNCGGSPFPLTAEDAEQEKKRMKKRYDVDVDYRSLKEYFLEVEKRKIAINYATLLGHGTLRGFVMGLSNRKPTDEELIKMKEVIAECMKAGALGISSGLEYTPGSFAETSELIELCKVVAKYHGVYATHLRNEDDQLIEAVTEAIKIAQESKVSLQISHLKTCYPRNWHKIDELITLIETAKNNGVNLLADRYPYVAFATGLNSLFPTWVREGTGKNFVDRLKDPSLDTKLRDGFNEKEVKFGSWDKVFISELPKNNQFEGKNILELSKTANKNAFEFVRDLLIEEESGGGMIVFAMSEDNLKRLLAHPLVVVGADGSAISPTGKLSSGKPHPRHYGSFARVLGKYSRDEKIFPLEIAVQKMTSTTANKFGLLKRGILKPGYYADIAIFNPDTVIDKSDFTNPHQFPIGVDFVLVNGTPVIKEGAPTNEFPGRVLRKVV